MSDFAKKDTLGGWSAEEPPTQQRRLGTVRHRALMLAMKGQHGEAARHLLEHLQIEPGNVARLDPETRRLASVAATYLHKAGDTQAAAVLFEALGETERALALNQDAPSSQVAPSRQHIVGQPASIRGDSGVDPAAASSLPAVVSTGEPPADLPPGVSLLDWAETLVKQGKPVEAAERLAAAGHAYEAGICYLKAGDISQALARLLRVAPYNVKYRAAARTVARVLGRVGRCDASAVQFFSAFLRDGPSDSGEIALFLRLSQLFEDNHFIEPALAVLEAVKEKFPEHPETLTRHKKLKLAAVSPTYYATEASGVELQQTEAPPPAIDEDIPPSALVRPGRLAPPPAGSPKISSFRRPPGEPPDAPAAQRDRHAARPSTVRVSSVPAPGDSVPTSLEPGMVIAERFKLNAQIGQGGMATVFSATDLELEEEVALKAFSGQLITTEWLEEAVQRFRQELKLCRKLRHPNIIQVYDIGIHAGHRYFTMELLRGTSLDKLLGKPLEVARAVDYLRQACAGLHAAHERGVVHRDVKPENIFVTDQGLIKIMDFGIAKSSYQTGTTTLGTLAGTPEYMAPEQIDDFSGAGPAADQYSLGIVGYYMLTGRVPFQHEQMLGLLMMHLRQNPRPLRDINPSLPEALESVILRMLAKAPQDRFATCRDVARQLAEGLA